MLNSIEIFAGAGGLALGLEKAGFNALLLNEKEKHPASTLKFNRPNWNVLQKDIKNVSFKEFKEQIDLLSGGFPCQTFSYAGDRKGFGDTRGTLFHEYARALEEIKPKMFLAENVKGLLSHDNGKTLKTIINVFEEKGYYVFEPKVLKAIHFKVPQKRERIFIIGIRKDLYQGKEFIWPKEEKRIYNLKDAFLKGDLYSTDVPVSEGQTYSENKKKVLDLVPPGCYWKSLPINIQKEYMKKSFYSGGGKTGMARRLSWEEPCLTLTCSPSQKQTERCHPDETRPLTVREYARIQTFPDNWIFQGSLSSQYKQIGNAVPVNLAYAVGIQVFKYLKSIV